MWWKIYFWFSIVLALISLVSFLAPEKQNILLHLFLIVTFCIALIGLYSFAFQKSLLSRPFWKYYVWFYVALDLLYLIYGFLPENYMRYVSFLSVYQNTTEQDTIINTALDIPVIYSMYRLAWNKPLRVVSKRKGPFRWGMIQTALWGYSSVLTFFLFIFAIFSTGDSGNSSSGSDPTYITVMFSPLLIFWLWVIIEYKKYKWDWLRTTLLANALLYNGSIIVGIFIGQSGQGSSGIDIISLLQLIILLISLYVFGKDQFLPQKNKQK